MLRWVSEHARGDATVTAARLLSHAGEHAAAWIGMGLLGAAVDRRRRGDWLVATGAVVAAHGASVVLKRVARRHRPLDERVEVRVAVPSRWSMPSSHATSTTAAAVVFAPLLGVPTWPLVPAMAASRLVLGVHYPSDVTAGALLGAVTAVAAPPHRDPVGGALMPALIRPSAGPTTAGPAWLRAMRPRQWVKNVLVLAPVLPAGRQVDGSTFVGAAVAFVLFCVVSSAVYLVNDARDVEADRAHPRKRYRPIAAGELGVGTAIALAVALAVVGLLAAVLWAPALAVVLGVYVLIQLAYCFGMKHEPVIELASVASGFLLRMLAGGTAAGIPLSRWFLLTAAFGSLFMAAGKRYGEARRGELTGEAVRRVVEKYSTSYLRFVWTLAATVVVTTYALWCLEVLADSDWGVVSIVPFVLAVLRYAVDVDRGAAEEPEEIALHDRVLAGLAVTWVVTMLLAVWA